MVPAAETDAELWSRAAGGDQDAFGSLFERHVQAVWNHAYRLTGSWSTAEDRTSATFLTAWRRRADVTLVRDSALPWLFTVVGNLARTEYRTTSRWARLVRRMPVQDDVSDHADAVAERVDGADRLRRLGAALRGLPRAQRQAVELCVLGELPVADVAELLGLAESTVRVNLSRARTRLRTELEINR